MYKINFILLSFLVVLLFPLCVVKAETDTEAKKTAVLLQQLHAIERYIEHAFLTKFESTKPLQDEVVKKTINEGVQWLIQSQEENGHFAYEYLPFEDEYRNDDNIVRQTGALFILAEIARRDKTQNAETNRAIEKAIGYFKSLSPLHEFEGTEVRCITKTESSKVCKLGATSLALTALLGYVEKYPTKASEYEDLIEGYVSFIMEAKKEDTGFRDQYTIGSGFKGEAESSFSNGEALLALVRYYQYEPEGDVKTMIDETFEYLEPQTYDTALYLWIMAALKDMQVLWPSTAYTEYTKGFTQWRLGELKNARNTLHNYCAANEGLASAYSVLEKSSTAPELSLLRKEIDFWNAKNRGHQIQTDDTFMLLPQEGTLAFTQISDMEQSRGGFLTGYAEPTQRIDFTQHCVSAYVQTLVDIDGESL